MRLFGIVPENGWQFDYIQNFRSLNISNLNITSDNNLFIYTTLYPFQGLFIQDDSPSLSFSSYLYQPTSLPNIFNPGLINPDNDSVNITFHTPLYYDLQSGLFLSCNYQPFFSENSPLPNQMLDPNNNPAVLNEVNGILQFQSFTQGIYCIDYLLKSYRGGQLISSSLIEFNLSILPITTSSSSLPNHPPVLIQSPQNQTDLDLNLTIGDTLDINLIFVDQDTLLNGFSQQLEAFINGSFFTDSTEFPTGFSYQISYSTYQDSAFVHITWITDCTLFQNQLFSNSFGYFYNFSVYCKDNFCPYPLFANFTAQVHLSPKPYLNPPEFTLESDSNCLMQVNSYPNAYYQWFRNGIPIDSANNSSYLAEQGGQFQLNISFQNEACQIFDTLLTMNCTGVGFSSLNSNLFLLFEENPGEFTLQSELLSQGTSMFKISDQFGQIIQKWNSTIKSNNQEHFYFLQPTGLYYLEWINSKGLNKVIKFMMH